MTGCAPLRLGDGPLERASSSRPGGFLPVRLYWGRNRPLSFLRYMTLVSLLHHNPNARLFVYYPAVPVEGEPWATPEQKGTRYAGFDYFQVLSELDRVELVPVQFQERWAGMPEVVRSDLLRWWLFERSGGWWSDTDIFYVAPLPPAPLGADFSLCYTKWVSIGFLWARGNDRSRAFYGGVAREAEQRASTQEYQGAGRFAVEAALSRCADVPTPWRIPYEAVYPVLPNETPVLYGRERLRPGPATVGVHWFGGHPASVEAEARAYEAALPRGWLFDQMAGLVRRLEPVT